MKSFSIICASALAVTTQQFGGSVVSTASTALSPQFKLVSQQVRCLCDVCVLSCPLQVCRQKEETVELN